jgi:SPP1 gp7 family putative phage head morphogenesis protein
LNSKDYWKRREEEALKHRITDEKEYDKRIKKIYSDMLDSCTKEINAFYGKYADKEGITLAEAKKRVKSLDIKEYERKAARYVKDKDFSPKANEEMRLYNATMKINRLEMLKANIGLEMIAGHDELEKFMSGILKGRTEDELKRQAGILGETVKSNAKKAEAIVNASFHNANFSDRIWLYQDLLKADLAKQLQSGLIQGKNPRVLARDIKKRFDVSTSNAERLMRTELARVQTEAQKQSFERNGFGQYSFIVNGGCCKICEAVAKKSPYKVAKMMPGENAPPLHPFCRCSTAAYEDSEDYEAWLEYLDKGGTTEEYNKLKIAKKKPIEKEESKPTYAYKETVVNKNLINSPDFRKKIDKISDNTEVNRSIWNAAKEMLQHRSGTKYEDLAFIDSTTGKALINKDFNKENHAAPNVKMKEMLKSAKPFTIIGVHNHPGSKVPSIPDIQTCINRQYNFGVVVCHNGKIYKYKVNAEKYNEPIAASALDRLEKIGYNVKVKNMFSDAGIEMEVI